MNKGIKKATGDIIGILNSDDIYYPEALSIINNYFLSDEKLEFLFGSVYKHKLMYGYHPNKIKGTFGSKVAGNMGYRRCQPSCWVVPIWSSLYHKLESSTVVTNVGRRSPITSETNIFLIKDN